MTARILMVTPDYPRLGERVSGGVSSACHGLVHALSRYRDLTVTVLVTQLATAPLPLSAIDVQEGSTRVIRLAKRRSRWSGVDVLWRSGSAVSRAIRAIPHDILHVQDLDRIAAAHRKENVVLTVHGIAEQDVKFRGSSATRGLRKALLRALCGRSRRSVPNLIAINPYVLECLGAGARQQIWRIPNAVNQKFFSMVRAPQYGRILVSGRIIPRKNIEGAIRCFAQIAGADREASLVLAGSGDVAYISRCQTLARELGVGHRVTFRGNLDPDSMMEELAQCHFLLLCSLQETAPMVISEALAAGTPVVTADVGGTRHMVQHGETGLVASYNDDTSLVGCMRELLSQPQLAMEMGSRAHQVALEKYHPDVVGAKMYDVYQSVLRR